MKRKDRLVQIPSDTPNLNGVDNSVFIRAHRCYQWFFSSMVPATTAQVMRGLSFLTTATRVCFRVCGLDLGYANRIDLVKPKTV